MGFRCPTCDSDIVTRVLADPVTLIVVGRCEEHGVLELSRVYIGEQPAYPTEPEPRTLERVAYKPGSCCGRRLGDHDWCQLPIGHDEPHAA